MLEHKIRLSIRIIAIRSEIRELKQKENRILKQLRRLKKEETKNYERQ